jgi:gamma-glutamyltranspeptidase/glutathione hydrolase
LSVDFRETAPAAAFEDMYEGTWMGGISGGLASAVPGDVKGLEYLHNKYGVSQFYAPARRY